MSARWLVALIIGLIGLTGRLEAQVSPGPLAKAHASLNGALKCTQCHGSGKDAMTTRCAACHQDVGWLAERGRGFHGKAPVKGAACSSCHPDHAGVDFELIKWPEGGRERFDHRRAGYPLEQAHAKLRCEQCHKAEFRRSPAAALAPGKRSSWTGLETGCASCHQDIHRGALGERCTSCHDTGAWTTTPGFRHDTTDYPLTGKHREVDCDQCHRAGRDSVPIYRPVPHQTCASCHADRHQGALGPNCAGCHSTSGFKEIAAGKGFDHARTRFPLRGRHSAVACAGCHRDFASEAGRRPPSSSCADCHTADPHGGSATIDGRAADCGACHSDRGFSPGVFPIERHAATRFPLEGKHGAVRCGDCHRKEPASTKWGTAKVVIRPAFATCLGCHPNQHGGELASRADKGECAACHRPAGWKPSTVDLAAHAKTPFPLDGRHAAIGCRACHGDVRDGLARWSATDNLGKARFAIAKVERTCAGCHLDPHGGAFEPGGRRPTPGGCRACHSTDAFLPATVDEAAHRRFAFALEGAHRALACVSCHRELDREAATKRWPMLVQSGIKPRPSRFEAARDCLSCHREQNPHGDQFAGRKGGAACEVCHDVQAFAPASRFDHGRDAAFKLDGGHRSVPCRDCHRSAPVGGVARVIYRPLGSRCEDCHQKR